ncbi:hypothetical protein MLIT_20020 [Mycolicibacterium litorale]|uniref:Uncharacterized protein n=1 Tax=Mycolicibacterium litorale TaxID=758802 RepID=A0AAD1MT65_9MYCO|nr:hypothetical protein MLIT_20020 [Mycolicibacterium litorale]
MLQVVGVQAAGGAAAGHHTGAVAMFEGAAQPPTDRPGATAVADDLAVAFEPCFAGGIAEQVAAVGVGQDRAEMQGGDAVFDVDMDDDGGVLAVGAARHVSVPAGFDQTHEPVDRGRKRWRLFRRVFGVGAFPLGDQRITM